MEETKEKYNKLKKKFTQLPDFDNINKEFDIENTDKISLASIRKKIEEKIELCLDALERILNPEPTNLADLYEYKFFTQEEKEYAFKIFKQLMQLYRASLESELTANKEEQAKTINKICAEFPEQREKMIPLIKKSKESWKKDIEHKEILRYMG
ncbi:hypothetical protein DRJ25_01505 [Candidatus Woesearchaeota archaeon]|nr:MAG: hypothetical protein DRJ25_01505 [Candidatus Woesearchaeota archaeon]